VPADGCVPLLINHEQLALHAAPVVEKFGVSSKFTIEQLDLYWRDAVVVAEERSHVPICKAFLDITLTHPGVDNSYICAVTVATTPWIPEEPEKKEIVSEKESVEQFASQIKSAEGGGGSCYPLNVLKNIIDEKRKRIERNSYSKSNALARYYDQEKLEMMEPIFNMLKDIQDRLEILEKK
jgi:hypothetical protein